MEEFVARELVFGITIYQVLVLLHIFGVAVGAGAAFFSDFLFTNLLKDRKFSKEEFRILMLNSRVVWLGLALLIISGVAIYSSNAAFLNNLDKFQAKMTILAILSANGILFHFYHLPMLEKIVGKDIRKQKTFIDRSKGFFISGAISGVSWAATITLGSLRGIELSYLQIMGIYVAVVAVAAAAALGLRGKYIK